MIRRVKRLAGADSAISKFGGILGVEEALGYTTSSRAFEEQCGELALAPPVELDVG